VNLGLVVGLGFLARGGRAYCNLLCPIGALDGLANRVAARFGRRVRIDPARCDGCGACAKVCPMWAIEVGGGTATIDPLACLPCRECEGVCPTDAIGYGRPAGLVTLRAPPAPGRAGPQTAANVPVVAAAVAEPPAVAALVEGLAHGRPPA
jgi:ferredoxin